MDLYRYFHPHHNPRLRNKAVRLQEIRELEQSAIELQKALKRAEIRSGEAPIGGIQSDHFGEILHAMNYVVESLGTLCEAHPGDEQIDMREMLGERESAPGWENWARLVKQRLRITGSYIDDPSSEDDQEEAEEEFQTIDKITEESFGDDTDKQTELELESTSREDYSK